MATELPADATAPGLARAIVRTALDTWPADLIEDAELIASELAANAVRHGAPPISIEVVSEPGGAVITVFDHGSGIDGPWPGPKEDAEGGRGLLLIERLAQTWGWAQSGGQTSFWAELAEPS